MANIAATSEKGLRKFQQDSYRFNLIGGTACLVVADGNGGNNAEVLSAKAADSCMSCLSLALSNGRDIGSDDCLRTIGIGAINFAADAVMQEKDSNHNLANAGTTITVVLASPPRAGAFWIGDSGAYIYDSDGLLHLTNPLHTLAERLIEQGQDPSIRTKQPGLNSVLTRCAGHESCEPSSRIIRMEGQAILLAGSDGVFGYLPEEALTDILKNNLGECYDIRELVKSIVDTSLLVYNSDDNCTLIGCTIQPHHKLACKTSYLTKLYEWR
ncbi:MAG: PP2C family protein-serine/threonine phosphatase [bacterium]